MNSEELEVSLRTEFENYLNGVRDEMRQQAAELQTKFETEFETHRSNLAEAFRAYSERFDSDQEFDEAFRSSVVEHLRLARDEGSRLAATAMVEAEELEKEAGAPADFTAIRDAINDISSHDSQSTILKALVSHSAEFAPRGAFFIVKNERFVGWKAFGGEGEKDDTSIRNISFPVSADSILGDAVHSLSTKEGAFGSHAGDDSFLDPLQYGQPDRMYAIPLVARGRGVAVMYVDYGGSGVTINVEALETLMRIAGLTVELLAATQTARIENRATGAADFESADHEYHELRHQEPEAGTESHTFEEPPHTFDETPQPEPQHAFDEAPQSFDETAESEFEQPAEHALNEAGAEPAREYVLQDDQAGDQTAEFSSDEVSSIQEPTSDFVIEHPAPVEETPTYAETFGEYKGESDERPDWSGYGETSAHHEPESEPAPEYHPEPVGHDLGSSDTAGAMIFDSGATIEPSHETSPFEAPITPEFEPALAGVSAKPEASIEVSPSNTGYTRLSNRPVDLPIEVAEDERRLHNDARRFARLLVSEIKLYNEKKVQEGRQSRDLYERLREAIDRSREMYDKRVQPPVAAKFDYFHYELVNALAEGEVERLGTGYPGSRV